MGTKLTLADAQAAAKRKGGKCLSKRYVSVNSLMLWECAKGHKWKARYSAVNKRTWCPTCANANKGAWKKKSISDAMAVAKSKGGRVLSKEMNGVESKLLWECGLGHRWEASYHMVSSETWCPICGREKLSNALRKYTTNDALRIIKNNKGELLSGDVSTANSLLKIQCNKGHIFTSSLKRLMRPNWCRVCSLKDFGGHNKLTISDARALAKKKGGLLISSEYKDSKSHLEWECKQGHRWTASYGSVIKHWCPKCQYLGNQRKFAEKHGPSGMKAAMAIAKAHKGKLLSTEWPGSNKFLLEWQCAEGHVFKQHLNGIRDSGSWCPKCFTKVREGLLHQIFEHLTGYHFIKFKPKWMRSPKNRPLELDGYCDELKLAFEYNGEQHYKASSAFKSDLSYIRQCDKIKRISCKKRGIKLLIFRHTKRSPEQIGDAVIHRLEKLNIPIIREMTSFKYKPVTSTRFDEARKIVKSLKGNILADSILDSTTKFPVECNKGHRWDTTLTNLKQGMWCRKCMFDRIRENPNKYFKRGKRK